MSKSSTLFNLSCFRVFFLALNLATLIVTSRYFNLLSDTCHGCVSPPRDYEYAHPAKEYSIVPMALLCVIYVYILLTGKKFIDEMLRVIITLFLTGFLLYSVLAVYYIEQKRSIEQYPIYTPFKCRVYMKEECSLVEVNKIRCGMSIFTASIVIVELMIGFYLARQEKNRIMAEKMKDQEKAVSVHPVSYPDAPQYQQPIPVYDPKRPVSVYKLNV